MTPWELVKTSEASHQRAIFAWANCAAEFGVEVACDPRGYALATRPPTNAWTYPPAHVLELLHAIHNQGHGDKIRGGNARAEGVKAGIPDIFLPAPEPRIGNHPPGYDWYHGLYIELKRPGIVGKHRKGVTNKKQDDTIPRLERNGYKVVVAVGWIEAVNAILEYLGHDNRVTP